MRSQVYGGELLSGEAMLQRVKKEVKSVSADLTFGSNDFDVGVVVSDDELQRELAAELELIDVARSGVALAQLHCVATRRQWSVVLKALASAGYDAPPREPASLVVQALVLADDSADAAAFDALFGDEDVATWPAEQRLQLLRAALCDELDTDVAKLRDLVCEPLLERVIAAEDAIAAKQRAGETLPAAVVAKEALGAPLFECDLVSVAIVFGQPEMLPAPHALGQEKYLASLRRLLEHGVDPNHMANGLTMLHRAGIALGVQLLLVEHGADLTIRDKNGNEPQVDEEVKKYANKRALERFHARALDVCVALAPRLADMPLLVACHLLDALPHAALASTEDKLALIVRVTKRELDVDARKALVDEALKEWRLKSIKRIERAQKTFKLAIAAGCQEAYARLFNQHAEPLSKEKPELGRILMPIAANMVNDDFDLANVAKEIASEDLELMATCFDSCAEAMESVLAMNQASALASMQNQN